MLHFCKKNVKMDVRFGFCKNCKSVFGEVMVIGGLEIYV